MSVWNMDLEPEQSLEGHEGGVWSVYISPDSTMIVSCDTGGEVKIWKKGGGGRWTCLKTLTDHTTAVIVVLFSPNG